MNITNTTNNPADPILVLGATGKTGSRVVKRLNEKGIPVRIGSRRATPAFDWENQATWIAALKNVRAAYISFYPDLAVPGTPEIIYQFCQLAVKSGVKHLVLLSGRGEEEAQRCEDIVKKYRRHMDNITLKLV